MPLNTPGGQEAFRNTLANSFVFKFYLEACRHFGIQPDSSASAFAGDKDGDSDDVEVEWKSAIERYERPVSSGFQEYQTPASAPSSSASPSSSPSPSPEVAKLKKNQHVGKNKKHMSANAQVTGEALYCDDIPDPQHTAHGALVSSRKPHANIMSVDTSEAEKAPGFIAYVSAKDVMGTNMIGDIFRDEELFATDVVHTVGQPIGVVLATTQQLACEAANKVKVEYEDILPAILSIEDAIEHKSFYDQHHWLQTGDNGAGVDSKLDENNFHVDDKTNVQKALADSPHVLTGRCKVGGQEHFYLETQACLAVPHEQDEMVVHSSTQNCTVTQEFVAEVLGTVHMSTIMRTCVRVCVCVWVSVHILLLIDALSKCIWTYMCVALCFSLLLGAYIHGQHPHPRAHALQALCPIA